MDRFTFYQNISKYRSNFLAHATNYKYYNKIQLPNGTVRYFYTKEEWDAYNNPKKVHTIDPKDNRVIEYNEDGSNARKLNTTWQQHRQGSIMEADRAIERSTKEGGLKSGIKAILRDDRMEEFFTQFEGGFENHGWNLTEDGKITGMSDEDKKYVKEIENWTKKFTDSNGNSIFDSKEFQDAVMKEIENRYKIAKDLKNDPDREKKIAEEDARVEEENRKAGEAMNKAISSVHKDEKTKRVEAKLSKLSEGGNVDLNNLPDVSVKELEKAGWDNVGKGKVKTYTSTFTSDVDGSCYIFSPIIVDPKTGKFLGVMSPEEFDDYCLDVVDGKRKDTYNLQIGGAYKGKDAEEKAGNACKEIDRLHKKLNKLKKIKGEQL